MRSNTLFVLMGLPRQVRDVLGEEPLTRLFHAHPQVRVEIVESLERFAERVPGADAVLVWPTFRLLPTVLQRGARLRWVQSIQTGINQVLTPVSIRI